MGPGGYRVAIKRATRIEALRGLASMLCDEVDARDNLASDLGIKLMGVCSVAEVYTVIEPQRRRTLGKFKK